MTLQDVLINYLDLFIALYVFITLLAGIAVHGLVGFFRSKQRASFKILVSLLIGASCLYLTIFTLVFIYVMGHTSFLFHIQNGDLLPHLKKAGL